MMQNRIVAGALALLMASGAPVVAAARAPDRGGRPAPVRITLPDEYMPFADIAGGPSADAVNNNCLSCHSAEMVLYQPKLSVAEWQGILGKMRSVYKAPVDVAEDAAITAWLTAMQAKR
jgi:cytochrome c5